MSKITLTVAMVSVLAIVGMAQAQTTYTWNSPAAGDWPTAANWTPADPPPPPGVADTANFVYNWNAINGGAWVVNLTQSEHVAALTVVSGAVSPWYGTFTWNGPTYTVTIDGDFNFNETGHVYAANWGTFKPIVAGNTLTVTAGQLELQTGSTFSGNLSLSKTGSVVSVLRLSGANTFGGANITSGELQWNNAAALGTLGTTTSLDMNAATFNHLAGGGATNSLKLTFDGGTYRFNAYSTDYTGTMTLDTSATITSVGGAPSGTSINKLAGSITGPGQLIMNCEGKEGVALTTANTFVGGLRLDGGQATIAVDGALGSGNGGGSDQPGPVVVNEGQTYDYYGEKYSYAGLTFVAPQTKNPVDPLTVNANGLLRFIHLLGDTNAAPTVYNTPFTLKDGGMLAGPGTQGPYWYDPYENNRAVTLTGAITINNGAKIYLGAQDFYYATGAAGDFLITGPISGGSPLVVTARNNASVLALAPAAANSLLTADWDIQGGTVRVDTEGALGTGAVLANGTGGTLKTNVTNATGSAASVTIDAGGKLNLNSQENTPCAAGTHYIEIKPNAAMTISAGGLATTFNWDWTAGGNFRMHNGAIIDGTFAATPITKLDDSVDSVFGVWMGANASATVGNGPGNAGIRGVATPGANLTLTSATTVTENAGNTVGINNNGQQATVADNPGAMFLATSGVRVELNGTKVVPVTGHNIQLTGPGSFVLGRQGTGSAATSNNFGGAQVDMRGTGRIGLGYGAMQKNTVINLYSGYWSDTDNANAQCLDGSTINLNAGTGMYYGIRDYSYTTTKPTIHISAGAYFSGCGYNNYEARAWDPDINYVWDLGSQITSGHANYNLRIGNPTSAHFSAGAGKADHVLRNKSIDINNDLVLGNNTRLVMDYGDVYHSIMSGLGIDGTYGEIRLATGAELDALYGSPAAPNPLYPGEPAHADQTQGRIVVASGKTAGERAVIRFGSGTLIVGEQAVGGGPATYRAAPAVAGGAFDDLVLGGTLRIRMDGSAGYAPFGNGFTFEKLDVQSGTFNCDGAPTDGVRTYIGTANEIHVAAGAQITNTNGNNAQALHSFLTGKGTMDFGTTLTVAPGMVDHSSVLDGTGKYQRNGSVMTYQDAGIKPGDSVGVLTINDNLAFDNYAGTNYPSLEIDVVGTGDAAGTDFDQLGVGGTLSGMGANLDLIVRFDSALVGSTFPPGREIPVVVSTVATAFVVDDYGADGIGVNTATQLFRTVTWDGGIGKIKVVDQDTDGLDGTILLYNLVVRIPGDADLNGYVDLPDLIALARNWKVTPATWGQGDFDGDKIVDLPDLIILARNWHAGTPPPAGGAVPEPASLVLLAVGGVVLLRRRAKS